MYKGPERRRHKRIQKPFMVRFRVRPREAGGVPADWDIGAVLNLGVGGALFYYNRKPKIDSFLDLKMNFPAYKGSINCSGKVIRVEELSYARMFLVAVVFADISEKGKEVLNKAIEGFYSKTE
jgi:hypothetical protein